MKQLSGVAGGAVVGAVQGDEGVAGQVFHVFMGDLDGGSGGQVLGKGGVAGGLYGGIEAPEHEGGVGAEHAS